MKIGILGPGNVGTTLGSRWQSTGHEVQYGASDSKGRVNVFSVIETVSWADVVVIATPWAAVPSVLANSKLYANKIVIDCTNPIAADFSGLDFAGASSAGERVAELIPEAKVVKAFNTCGFNVMANPNFSGEPASMLMASDHKDAKNVVLQLAKELNFEAVDAGPLSQSKHLEHLAWLWISMALKFGHGREIAFRFLHR